MALVNQIIGANQHLIDLTQQLSTLNIFITPDQSLAICHND